MYMKMRHLIIFLLFLSSLLFHDSCLAGGVTVGNGGAFIQCEGSSQLVFIDRLIYFEKIAKPLPVIDWRQNLFAIAKILGSFQDKKLKSLSQSLFQFITFAFVEYSEKSPWIWINQGGPLRKMYNPWFDGKLPRACTQVFQAVYRFGMDERDQHIRFHYSGELIQTVLNQKEGHLEISFLLLHEWLWTFFENNKDPIRLAQVNQIMHSSQLNQMKAPDVLSLF